MIDRLSIRSRPEAPPVMYQTWAKLLFLHWPISVEELQPHIPDGLAIDTYDGIAWIALTPFTMWNLRPPLLPAIPYLSSSHELNVRTYVHHDGVPGVWFFSLDASNPLAVLGARAGFALPYFLANMKLKDTGKRITFSSHRTHIGAQKARFQAQWSAGEPLPELEPGTRDFFLIERYCLYTTRRGRLYRARIHHDPWPLQEASLDSFSSTMVESHGIEPPAGQPLLHMQARPLKVAVWRLERA